MSNDHRLVDFDWVVHEIVSSSMCDDHSVFASNENSNNQNVSSSSSTDPKQKQHEESTKSLREPLNRVLRLELLLQQQHQGAKPTTKLYELSKREVDQLIEAIRAAI